MNLLLIICYISILLFIKTNEYELIYLYKVVSNYVELIIFISSNDDNKVCKMIS